MSSRGRRVGALVLGVAALSACAGLPTPGGVHAVRTVPVGSLPDPPDLRKEPAGPQPASDPQDTVSGFLAAAGDLAIAREYLDPLVAWDPTQVEVYDAVPTLAGGAVVPPAPVVSAPTGAAVRRSGALAGLSRTPSVPVSPVPVAPAVVSSVGASSGVASASPVDHSVPGSTATVAIDVVPIARVSADGSVGLSAGPLHAVVRLEREEAGWRLTDPPPQLLLSTGDLRLSRRVARLAWLDATGTALVRDPVLLDVTSDDLPTAEVRALLQPPGARLTVAGVTTAAPRGARLLDVRQDGGTVTVDLTGEALDVSRAQLSRFVAQLTATLLDAARGTTALRVLVNGQSLSSDVLDLDTDALPDGAQALVAGATVGRPGAVTGTGLGLAQSDDGERIALLRPTAGGAEVVVTSSAAGASVASLPATLAAGRWSSPTWTARDTLLLLRDGRLVALAPGAAAVRPVTGVGLPGRLRSVRVARDGVHVVLIGADGRLRTALLGPDTTLSQVSALAPQLDQVSLATAPVSGGVVWAVGRSAGMSGVFRVPTGPAEDGTLSSAGLLPLPVAVSAPCTSRGPGAPAQPAALSAAGDEPLLAACGGTLEALDPGTGWHQAAGIPVGAVPSYPGG